MSNHFLTRNPENEPVCSCGFRPDILDEPAPVGKQWKAKTAVLEHVTAVAPLFALAFQRRSPDAPFVVADARYPRAGVRQMADGRWLLMGWDREDVAHGITDVPWFYDRAEACEVGRIIIGAHRQSGTDLNGLAVS